MKLNLSKSNYNIFLFHGVIRNNKYKIRNYTRKHLLEDYFIKQIKYLKNKGNAISLEEFVHLKKNKHILPKNSFSITFDDGFENNYSLAAPILDDLRVPATFYFSTDFIENNTMSWIDKVEYCFEIGFALNKIFIKDFGIFDISTIKKKMTVLNQIRFTIKNNRNINVNKFVKNVFKAFGIREVISSNNPLDKKISWKQILKLKKNRLFTIGAHSHIHMPITYFSKREGEKQIDKSIDLFKKRINHKIIHYSYPEGQLNDFNLGSIKYLKKNGIICSPTAINGSNNLNTDLFYLKRINVI